MRKLSGMGLDTEALRGIRVTHNFNFCLLCWDAGNMWGIFSNPQEVYNCCTEVNKVNGHYREIASIVFTASVVSRLWPYTFTFKIILLIEVFFINI